MKPVSNSPVAGVLIVARREAFNKPTRVQYHFKSQRFLARKKLKERTSLPIRE
jgi:hypothetical protein